MAHRKETTRRRPIATALETLEARLALSGALSTTLASPPLAAPYVAVLELGKNVPTTDRATGKITLRLDRNGSKIDFSGHLANISNVSAIVLHQTAAPGSMTPSTALTVGVLLKPGAGSGAVAHRSFNVSITNGSLTGVLVGHTLREFLQLVQQGEIQVVVQTSNGVDSTSQPGNVLSGELVGTFEPLA